MMCQSCGEREASASVMDPDDGHIVRVCAACFAKLAAEARDAMVEDLRAQDPYPGEDFLYQPVELPDVAGWRMARPDTLVRAEQVFRIAAELGVDGNGPSGSSSYMDVGCNTGAFCDYFATRGFAATGVDATRRFIRVARMLESFYRHPNRANGRWVDYVLANAYEYLEQTQAQVIDVTSSFAVFQWVMVQRTVEHGLQCLEWLARKTGKVCFIEFPYTSEEMYRDRIGIDIDRAWVLDALHGRAGFSDVRVVGARDAGLQRDLFVCIR